jgi:hypothetical protein
MSFLVATDTRVTVEVFEDVELGPLNGYQNEAPGVDEAEEFHPIGRVGAFTNRCNRMTGIVKQALLYLCCPCYLASRNNYY